MAKRGKWSSRFGYIMAAAGFSIGLGNIWRFPYLVGTNGGGAFVLVYIIICIVIGLPLFYMEIALGRKTQLNPIQGMRSLTKKGSPWVSFGWLGVISAFLILAYYFQIMGWIIAYLVKMVTGQLSGLDAAGYSKVFSDFTSNPTALIIYTAIGMIIVGIISSKSLNSGLEKACKFMMPALFIMLVLLAIRSLTLPGAGEGLKWYLNVDFSKINGDVLLTALGQAFFSIGIASGGAFIYGSYLKKNSDIPVDGASVVAFDLLAALIAGVVIFPAIFALNLDVDSGSNLLFVTMSNLFSQIPLGSVFGSAFFLLILFAALSSALGYLEPVSVSIAELGKKSRPASVWIALVAIFIASIPPIMAMGPWKDVTIIGKNFFDFADYISGNIAMPLGALVLIFYTVSKWKFSEFKNELNHGAQKIKVTNAWKPIVMLLLPASLVIIFVMGIGIF